MYFSDQLNTLFPVVLLGSSWVTKGNGGEEFGVMRRSESEMKSQGYLKRKSQLCEP